VGPRAGLDTAVKRKIPSSRRKSNPDRPARSQSLYRLSYPLDVTVSGWVPVACLCEYYNEQTGSIKVGYFSTSYFLK
jgi:hypothetical protein